ncbi:FKBP-type peptidyl-prolyl cis-trans isomerase [Tenacibaculum crassostreae]|uniref:FKBP-type peptidyl-prolyl cis-trans isomerase n=1 Tax=Tenacibaculum crassostreae TaxID=502683 RepID=UPI003894D0A1
MIKFKHVFYAITLGVILYSCGSDGNNSVTPFDHEAQAVIDNDSLVKFLDNHYYDTTIDSIKLITNGETSLLNDSKLKTIEVNENDIDYKVYVYIGEEGSNSPSPDKGFPTIVDSVYTKYQLWKIDDYKTFSLQETGSEARWWNIYPSPTGARSTISGWKYGFADNFKGGYNNTSPGGKINYINGGKGIMFLPSGLGYRNGGSGSIPGNTNLIFYVELWDFVPNTDHDNDNVPTFSEIEFVNGKLSNLDTDGNRVADYIDSDDDGDGVLTKDEDRNKDGDPRNDFNDPNKPTVPDYLNRDVRVKS